MVESLWLWFGRRWCGKSCSGFFGRVDSGEERDLILDSATKVKSCLLDVGWVVVGFIGVLRPIARISISLGRKLLLLHAYVTLSSF